MIYLPTWQAQTCVVAEAWATRTPAQQTLWLTLLTACQSPGIPLHLPIIQGQLAYIWEAGSTTYQQLMALREVEHGGHSL